MYINSTALKVYNISLNKSERMSILCVSVCTESPGKVYNYFCSAFIFTTNS